MDWGNVEIAIRNAVKTASGIANGQVTIGEQDMSRPVLPHITIKVGSAQSMGSTDEVTHDYDADRDPGEEIEFTVKARRDFAVSIQCFTALANKNSNARAILSRVQASLSLPSVIENLSSSGVSVYDLGRVEEVSTVLDTGFEGRAVLELRCYATETVTERTTWIETVEFTSYMGPPDEGTAENIEV